MKVPDPRLSDLVYVKEQAERLYNLIENGYADGGTETTGNIIKASELLEETLDELETIRGEEREKTSREFEEDCWRAIK